MDIRTLRQVLAIRQHGSFARAAQALGLSQPSLSKNIARLEDELKGQLFLRGATGAAPTPFGELVIEQAKRVLEETAKLQQAAQLAAGGASSLLRLGFGPDLKHVFAPQLLSELIKSRPQLNLQIEVCDRRRLLPAVVARELDLIFCIRDEAVAGSGMVITPVLSSFGVAVAAPDHPLAKERRIPPERFLQFAHAGPRNAAFATATLLGVGATDAAAYRMNDYEVFLPLVKAGLATLAMPAFEAEPLVSAGALVEVDVIGEARLEYAGVATPAASTSPIVQDVLRRAQAIGRRITAGQQRLRRNAAAPLPSPPAAAA